MIRKAAFGTIAAVALLAGYAPQSAAQGAPKVVTCTFPWCPNYVVVTQSGSSAPATTIQWDEMRMQRKLSDGTVLWLLLGSPDYEFRANSVVATGTNTAGASTQFPVRQISDTRFALDDLNTNDLTYTYEVRVYRRGSPPDATPVVLKGTIVNSFN
jgi:hypothetical protein